MGGAARKNLIREIRGSLGRYLAILGIIALGAGFLTGLQMTKPAMIETAQVFLDEHAFFDYELLSTLGFEAQDVAAVAEVDGVAKAEGGVSLDVLLHYQEEADDAVYKVHQLPVSVNTVALASGRMPEKPGECLADAYVMGDDALGRTLEISGENTQDILDSFAVTELTVVGTAYSPLYLNYERGTSGIGNGQVTAFLYVTEESLDLVYYTEIWLTLDKEGGIYSEEYDANATAMEDPVTDSAEVQAHRRYTAILDEAMEAIQEARAEYQDGLEEYEAQRADAEAEMADAQAQLDSSEYTLRQSEAQLRSGEAQLAAGQAELDAGRAELEATKTETYAQLDAAQAQLDAGRLLVEQQLATTERAMAWVQENAAAVDSGLGDILDILAQQLPPDLAGRLPENVTSGEVLALLQDYRTQLQTQQQELEANQAELDAGRALAEEEFANAEAQLAEAQAELDASAAQIQSGYSQIWSGYAQLESGRQDLAEARAEADEEFAKAEAELADAKEQIDDAEAEVQDIEAPTVYVLGRGTNMGYVCFESDSGIVEGVARVFPLFFFLVAALVCITTMTKMVDEQRTQIGVMKALGYSSGTIMVKYLLYSGSASLLGCVLGVSVGMVLFPTVVWQAYSMMYGFSDLILVIRWPIVLLVVGAFLGSMLGVTWLCCRSELRHVPAELIRPKAPKAGKRIFLEYLGFLWKRLKFLDKVALRNIFRYKKRLFMMIVGIGGCTALLVTGFGIQDSIADVVDYQYSEICLYDGTAEFTDAQDSQQAQAFQEEFGDIVEDTLLLHQSFVDLEAGGQVKSVYLLVADSLDGFMDLHDGDTPVAYPGEGEVVINNGLAENCGLEVGDTISFRTADLEEITVTISGIFDNNVYHYMILSPETVRSQLGRDLETKTVYFRLREGEDAHAAAAELSQGADVASVSMNADMQSRVDNMMQSLDYIVILVIFCAGALAFIVMYNLTNINITERLREIATLKVLGFYPMESAAYVFREGLALTAIGAAIGLVMGKLLPAFVLSQIQVDMMRFDARVLPMSYIYSVALTFLFSIIVDVFMYRKLEKINMAEALKAIE